MESEFKNWFDDQEAYSYKEMLSPQSNFIDNHSMMLEDEQIDLFNPQECISIYDQHLTNGVINNLMNENDNQISFPDYDYEISEIMDTFAEHRLKSVEDFIQSYKENKPRDIPDKVFDIESNELIANEKEKPCKEILMKSQNFIFSTKNSEIENKLSINDKISDTSMLYDQSKQKKVRKASKKTSKVKAVNIKPMNKKRTKASKKTKLHKNSKPTYEKENIKNKDLSKRKDVVNKTLLRSLKRYFSNLFKDSCDDYLRSKKSEITNFVCENGNKLTVSSVKKFIEIMISPIISKKKLKKKGDKLMYSNFYSCLYEYSHTKLYELLRTPQLRFLLLDYFRDGMEIMISSDKTLMKNPDVYQEASRRFINLINN